MLSIDHFVIGARDLDQGTAWAMERFGVAPSGGGKHPLMGTHNSLWRLGMCYLEVIAIDPAAEKPAHARWYGLDELDVQDSLMERPRLLTWVVASDDLATDRARAPIDPGPMRRFTRGDLWWDLSIPLDGKPRKNGTYPAMISWPEDVQPPAKTLMDSGLRVEKFTIAGPTGLHKDLKSYGVSDLYERQTTTGQPALDLTLRSVETLQTIAV